MRPTFTVLIGTMGRPTLKWALKSFRRQALIPGDQIIVGLDVFNRPAMELPEFYDLIHEYAASAALAKAYVHGFAHAGTFAGFGIPQLNYALMYYPITGSHVTTIGDDDIFVDGAFAKLRYICEEDQSRVVFSKFLAPNRWVLPNEPAFRACFISGCNILAPRQFVGLHPERNESTHDYVWMEDILNRSGREPRYVDLVSVIARPDISGTGEPFYGGIWHCKWCGLGGPWGYHQRGTVAQCPNCRREVVP